MGFVLFLVALILSVILFPIAFVYSIAKLILGYTSRLLFTVAIGIDMIGNVVCADLFNDLLIKKDGHRFGSINETVSKVLGLNKRTNTLSKTGMFLSNLLNTIHKRHVEIAAGY